MPNATDEVTGIVAPVVVRTLGACGKEPVFILLGDKRANKDTNTNAYRADAEKLHHAFYRTLPGHTYANLIRLYLASWLADEIVASREPSDLETVRDMVRLMEMKCHRTL